MSGSDLEHAAVLCGNVDIDVCAVRGHGSCEESLFLEMSYFLYLEPSLVAKIIHVMKLFTVFSEFADSA